MRKLSIATMKPMIRYGLISAIILMITIPAAKAHGRSFTNAGPSPIEGHWDITIDLDGKKAPSWLEVRHSGLHTLVGQFVGISGSARPISRVNFSDGKVSFAIPPQWEPEDSDLQVEGTLNEDEITGTMIFSNGKTYNWTAIRAPLLRRKSAPTWGQPITLFSGKNIAEWHTEGDNQWKAE
ncbi:MAG: DUF1080 domain-containing protein, partial [Ginsengibacter sp.]